MSTSVRRVATKAELIAALGPAPADGRALILLGGADHTEPERLAALRALFATIAGWCERTGTAVVDGGTDSGVMRLIAEARTSIGAGFRLIGVAPEGAFERRTRDGGRIERAREHSLVIAVPGKRFGDETDWLFGAADHLAGGSAPAIVVNGGRLARVEAHQRLAAGNRVIAVAGSGRAADELVAELAADEALRGSGRLRVMPLTVDDAALGAALDA